MNHVSLHRSALPLVALCFLFIPANAYAYIDLGSGSYMLQILLASFLGVAFSLKVFWRRIRVSLAGFFTRKSKDELD